MSASSLAGRLFPKGMKQCLKDRLEDWKRRRPGPLAGDARFGLTESQVYPQGTNFDECLRAGITRKLAGLAISKDTPVASIGSCFAEEFAAHMRQAGFNYVMTEPDMFAASANWGRVYTIPCLNQIVRYSTDEDFPLTLEPSRKGWYDPLREAQTPHYPTREAAEAAVLGHRAASLQAFRKARVIIVTLGQNEAWVDKKSGLAWARIPPKEALDVDRARFEARDFSFEENSRALEESFALLRKFNPELKILMTVSPVAAHATFCDPDVITRSFAGKCLLRAVAERAVRSLPNVWYFPSFELTLACNPHTFKADNRHVKLATVDRIFGMLQQTVVH